MPKRGSWGKSSVCIKIETGLNRTGVLPGKTLDEPLEALKEAENTEVRGDFLSSRVERRYING